MVKNKKGSRVGKTKLTKTSKKVARRAGKLRKSAIPKGPVRDAWNMRLSSIQNLSRIGLAPSVNTIRQTGVIKSSERLRDQCSLSTEQRRRAAPQRVDVLRQLELEAAKPEKVSKQVVAPGEERALSEMIAAHGDDFEAMSRDIKRNYLQWTPNQLRRKCERRARILASSTG